MRKALPFTVLLASLLAGACSDTGPAGSTLSPTGSFAKSRSTLVDGMIRAFFPKGLETATGTRFDHIDATLGTWNGTQWSGDVKVARTQVTELIKFVKNKAREIDPAALQPGEDLNLAAARLALAMFTYVYNGPDAALTPPAPPAGATDVVFEIVPAGTAALIQTPSKQAGLRLDDGSTLEDRVIVIAKNPLESEFTERCSGPLQTDRCQYKHFYKFESYPLLKLQKSGRFAVCHVFGTGGPTATEDGYIQLAHNLPADPDNYTTNTPGAIQEGQIEILPRATTQTGVVSCNEPTTTIGVVGTAQRAWYAVAKFAEKLIAPKAAYAYDQGPEHNGDFFSDFVGVGAPDFVGTWNGTTLRDGFPESSAQPITVNIFTQSDAGVTGEYLVAVVGDDQAYNIAPATPGDPGGWGRAMSASSVRFNGLDFTIDPFFSPSSGAIKLERMLNYTVVDGIPKLSGPGIRTLPGGVTDTWTITLYKASTPIVCLPPGCNVITLRAAPLTKAATTAEPAPIE